VHARDRASGCDAGRAGRAREEADGRHAEHLDHLAPPHRDGDDAKKKSIHATEAERPDVVRDRESFHEQYDIQNARRLIFLDETGIQLGMTRAYARAPRGERAIDAVPKGWGDNITVTACLTTTGIIAPMMHHGAMNARAFEAYVEQCLVPELRPGDLLILDRLSSHRMPFVHRLVEAAGAKVLHLPPYSPDFNPIEHAWSKLKALLRKARALTIRALLNALRIALRAISAEDAHGWFSNCGYGVP
jgi:transposase